MDTQSAQRFTISRTAQLPTQPCPCGLTQRSFVDDPERIASLHRVKITDDAVAHYHRETTEIYFVLEGSGEIELDGNRYPVTTGDSILIKPGCWHRALGQLTIINVAIPAFDPQDEWFE
jgi:mannose-6-phosphate isomerase-like protein (cupin superfamily)